MNRDDNRVYYKGPEEPDKKIPPKAPGEPPGGGPRPDPPKRGNLMNMLLIMFLFTFVMNLFLSGRGTVPTIGYSQFLQLIDSGSVQRVELDETHAKFVLKEQVDTAKVQSILKGGQADEQEYQLDRPMQVVLMDDPELVTRLKKEDVTFFKRFSTTDSSPFISFISRWLVPILLLYLVYSFLFRSLSKRMGQGGMGSMFNMGKSAAKEYQVDQHVSIRFKDVAGQDEAKESLEEILDFLHDPQKYKAIGARQPKGALLVGPPGTGKTLLAKAVAGEAGVPFYFVSGSEFVEMFVGVGAKRVRDLFEEAKKKAPCILFIDEIDAMGKSRDSQLSQNDEREQTLNQLLAEMDGFDGDQGIVVLGATNRPEVLDKALLRPGRFDRRIIVDLPDLPGREAILKVHIEEVKTGTDIDLREIALATSGASGADLANMINEAALLAVKDNRDRVLQKDLLEAVEVVIAGKEKKDRVMNPVERRMVAYHEVGHALVSALQKKSQPVQKITIVPRTHGSLGYTMNVPEEERYLMTRSEILAQIRTLLGGRAAEIIHFGETTTGASNDIERATKLARGMVTQYGMSDNFGPMGLESVQSQYLDGRNVFTGAEQTHSLVDEEVGKILRQCQDEAVELLREHETALNEISEYLLDRENITGKEFMELLKKTETLEEELH